MAPKRKKKKKERHLTAEQQKQMNREENLRRGMARRAFSSTVEGTPWTTEEHTKLNSTLLQMEHQKLSKQQDDVLQDDVLVSDLLLDMEKKVEKKESREVIVKPHEVIVYRSWGREAVKMRVLPVSADDVRKESDDRKMNVDPILSEILNDGERMELFRLMGLQREQDTSTLIKKIATLGPSQLRAYYRAVDYHETLFLTGGAGKGKTHLLLCIIEGLRLGGRSVAVLAPTGVAAHHIHGSTIHSFMKLSPIWYDRPLSSVVQHFKKHPEKLLRFQVVDTIVIDEISMVSAKIITWLDHILKIAHQNSRPFGGIQLLVCGDFFQLPPVAADPSKNTKERRLNPADGLYLETPEVKRAREVVQRTLDAAKQSAKEAAKKAEKGYPKRWQENEQWKKSIEKASEEQSNKAKRLRPQFCFETPIWRTVFTPDRCIELLESFRQRDPAFIQLLNHARIGKLTEDDIETLRIRHQNTLRRLNAESRQQRWAKPAAAAAAPLPAALNTASQVMASQCREMSNFRVRLFSTCAQVDGHNEAMRVALQRGHNNPLHVYNTTYVLRPWDTKQLARIADQKVWFAENRKLLRKDQRLFYAEFLAEYDVTQEEALDKIDEDIAVDDKLEFCVGARVMLMKNWQTTKGLVHGRTGWITGFGKDGPMVVFDEPDTDWSLPGAIDRYVASAIEVPPLEWSTICDQGRVVASQVPLSFAWAITIHKSQGLSMKRAEIDLNFLFDSGQGYVALSRLTTLGELGLLGIKPEGIYADPRVIAFYEQSFPNEKPIPLPSWLKHNVKLPPLFPPLPLPLFTHNTIPKVTINTTTMATTTTTTTNEPRLNIDIKDEQTPFPPPIQKSVDTPLPPTPPPPPALVPPPRPPSIIEEKSRAIDVSPLLPTPTVSRDLVNMTLSELATSGKRVNLRESFSSVKERERTEQLLLGTFGADFVSFLQLTMGGSDSYTTSTYMQSIPTLINPLKSKKRLEPENPAKDDDIPPKR